MYYVMYCVICYDLEYGLTLVRCEGEHTLHAIASKYLLVICAPRQKGTNSALSEN